MPTTEAPTIRQESSRSKLKAGIETPRADIKLTKELIFEEAEIIRSEIIDVSRIKIDASIVDDNHVSKLSASMKKKRGQVSPITVRVRLDEEGDVAYDVIDGFHRANAKYRDNEPDIEARVVYNCDDEEMYDLRVLAAGSVKSVQFARVAEWISQSYAASKFADSGLSVAQVFGLAQSGTKRPRNIDLEPEKLEQLKQWAVDKCEQWGKPVSSTYNVLRIVEDASPLLVRRVRTKGGGRDRTGQVTEKRLEVLVDVFPGEENFTIQEILMDVMTDNRLYTEEAKNLAEELRGKIDPSRTKEQIYDLANAVCREHEVAREARKSGLSSFMDGMPDPTEPSNGHERLGTSRRKGAIYESQKDTVEGLKEQVAELQARLEEATSGKGKGVDKWWMKADYLCREEIQIWERVLFGREDLDSLAREFGIGIRHVLDFVRSSLVKREMHLPKPKPKKN